MTSISRISKQQLDYEFGQVNQGDFKQNFGQTWTPYNENLLNNNLKMTVSFISLQ